MHRRKKLFEKVSWPSEKIGRATSFPFLYYARTTKRQKNLLHWTHKMFWMKCQHFLGCFFCSAMDPWLHSLPHSNPVHTNRQQPAAGRPPFWGDGWGTHGWTFFLLKKSLKLDRIFLNAVKAGFASPHLTFISWMHKKSGQHRASSWPSSLSSISKLL